MKGTHEIVQRGHVLLRVPLEVTGVSRVLPLLRRHLYAALAQVLDQFLHGSRVTHYVVLAVEEERGGGDGGAPKGTDAGVKVLHGVPPEDAEVKQAHLSYQRLPLWKYGFPKSWKETRNTTSI